jgi:hypothetical protein
LIVPGAWQRSEALSADDGGASSAAVDDEDDAIIVRSTRPRPRGDALEEPPAAPRRAKGGGKTRAREWDDDDDDAVATPARMCGMSRASRPHAERPRRSRRCDDGCKRFFTHRSLSTFDRVPFQPVEKTDR